VNDQVIVETLQGRCASWKNLFLVDASWNLYGLVIEDDTLWRECIEFLNRSKARWFGSRDEATAAFISAASAKNEYGN
jgi:hypothetical protein